MINECGIAALDWVEHNYDWIVIIQLYTGFVMIVSYLIYWLINRRKKKDE